MRQSLLLGLFVLSGCNAIVGDYEVAPRDAATDSVSDSASFDAGPDTPVITRTGSCKAILAANPSSADGAYASLVKGEPLTLFCDMRRGGYTLVALRGADTPATNWELESKVTKTKSLDTSTSGDAVLDIDWRNLEFGEVVYELGSTDRIAFTTLSDAQKDGARRALSSVVNMDPDRPSCTVEGDPGPPKMFCKPPPPPPGDSGLAFGWVFSPIGKLCYWAYRGANGAMECHKSTIVPGRVWVR